MRKRRQEEWQMESQFETGFESGVMCLTTKIKNSFHFKAALEYRKKNVDMSMTESLCYTAEIGTML